MTQVQGALPLTPPAEEAGGGDSQPSSLPLAKWNCRTDLPSEGESAITVGQKFKVSCSGEPLENIPQGPVVFKFANDEEIYTLHPLKLIHADQTSLTAEVTSYKPGSFKEKSLHASFQSGEVLELSSLSWTTQTVLKEDSPKEPYGPLGPIDISFPMWFWAAVLGPLLIISIWFIRVLIRHSQRRRLLRELESHSIAINPYFHFNKEIRAIKRKYLDTGDSFELGEEYISELNKSYRLFLVRQLKVPAHEWPLSAVMSSVKKYNHKIYQEVGGEIYQTLAEMEKMLGREGLSFHDCDQLTSMVVDVATKIYEFEGRR